MNPDGSGLQNLTNNPADDRDPAWSGNGGQIAFSTDRGTGGNYEIFVMNADGSNQHNLTNSPENDRDPYWDTNSDAEILFVRELGASGEIFVMNSDGSGQVNLTNNPADDREPAKGEHVGFLRYEVVFATDRGSNGNYEIFKMAPDGSGQVNLTNDAANDREPAWAYPFPEPQIAFSTNRGSNGNDEIFVMDGDGSNQRNLTNSSASDRHPYWSLSAYTIVFSSRAPGGDDEIYALYYGSLTNLSNHAADDLGPSVSHLPPPPPAPPPPPGPPPPVPPPPPAPPPPAPPPPAPPPPPATRCLVPRVIGMTLRRARARIHARRCSVGRVRRARSARVGRVIRQSPRPGSVKRRGYPVGLVVGRR